MPVITIHDFHSDIIYRCSSCGNKAQDISKEVNTKVVSCIHCGFRANSSNDLDLYYMTDYRGNSLWAYNTKHLDFLYESVSNKIRPNIKDDCGSWRNQSLLNRLPAWMMNKSNRESVLKKLDLLRSFK